MYSHQPAAYKQHAGFSLIELLISMTIFSIVVTIATSTLLVLIDANSRALNKQAILNNFTFALDSLTREVRSGYNYYCDTVASEPSGVESFDATQDCASGGNYLSFIESGDGLTTGSGSDKRISYYYDAMANGSAGALKRRLGTNDWFTVTDPNITFTASNFVVTNTGSFTSGDLLQPTVTVFFDGEAGALENTDTSFKIQASITQRALDI